MSFVRRTPALGGPEPGVDDFSGGCAGVRPVSLPWLDPALASSRSREDFASLHILRRFPQGRSMSRLPPEWCPRITAGFDEPSRGYLRASSCLPRPPMTCSDRVRTARMSARRSGRRARFLLDPFSNRFIGIPEFFGRQSAKISSSRDDSGPRPEDPGELECFRSWTVRFEDSTLRLVFQSYQGEHATGLAEGLRGFPLLARFSNITATATFSDTVLARNVRESGVSSQCPVQRFDGRPTVDPSSVQGDSPPSWATPRPQSS